jgi:hypothetical protein
MQPIRYWTVVALISALHFWAAGADAAEPAAGGAPTVVGPDSRDAPEAKIRDAARVLEQAALQADFASDARELALLQQAHDDLTAAVDQLNGVQRDRARGLLDDLEHAIHGASTRLGALITPFAEPDDPPAPSRDQLAQLATEAQELERQSPTLHRLVDSVTVRSAPDRDADSVPPAPPPSPIDVANQELLRWPLGVQTVWPQIRYRF